MHQIEYSEIKSRVAASLKVRTDLTRKLNLSKNKSFQIPNLWYFSVLTAEHSLLSFQQQIYSTFD